MTAIATIVALGDSTTAGSPAFKSPIEAPPDGSGNIESQYAYWLTAGHPDWRVLNRGVDGERSDEIRARFARDVVLAESVERELEAMYDLAGAAKISVVAGSIIPYNTATPEQNARMRAVNGWIRDYAARHDGSVTFCDTRAAVAEPGRPDRLVSSPDDLHPSPQGYRLMADALEPAIRTSLAKAHALR